jgi:hypothetical protein
MITHVFFYFIIHSDKELHVTWREEPWVLCRTYFVESAIIVFAHFKLHYYYYYYYICLFVVALFVVNVNSGSAYNVLSGLLYIRL